MGLAAWLPTSLRRAFKGRAPSPAVAVRAASLRHMDALPWIRDLVLLLHLLGFAALFGGAVVQLRSREPLVNGAMLHGTLLALVSGLALVGLDVVEEVDLDAARLGVKGGLTLLVTVLVVANRRFDSVPKGVWAIITGLTLALATVSVVW